MTVAPPTTCEACERDRYEIAWSEQLGRWVCGRCHLRLTADDPADLDGAERAARLELGLPVEHLEP